ncbi:hypothetical protein TNCV_3781661 [Trichonephila clavipes]|nr:hypothetical protein TNCV_3781661 [Trichonephila clavipes]
MNGLSLCSWNTNGLFSESSGFRLFVEENDPDILIQETRLRPTLDININNYTCYRNDRITNGPASGGTLIFIKSSIPRFNCPTLHVEATTVTLTPPNTNHLDYQHLCFPQI